VIGDRWGVSDSEVRRRWAALGLSIGDLVMARRQLLNLKQLGERNPRRHFGGYR
jgi:hypothetical protein